ncbi:hypothetical protein RDABS01_031081 [Bienertia sinuspersici]
MPIKEPLLQGTMRMGS